MKEHSQYWVSKEGWWLTSGGIWWDHTRAQPCANNGKSIVEAEGNWAKVAMTKSKRRDKVRARSSVETRGATWDTMAETGWTVERCHQGGGSRGWGGTPWVGKCWGAAGPIMVGGAGEISNTEGRGLFIFLFFHPCQLRGLRGSHPGGHLTAVLFFVFDVKCACNRFGRWGCSGC